MQPSSFWPLLLQFYQQCELWKHLRIWHMLRFHFTLTHYRHQHLKITRVSISIYLGLLHYVRVSQFYWHFCKSTNFPIELALSYYLGVKKLHKIYLKNDLFEFNFTYSRPLRPYCKIHTKLHHNISVESWKSYIVLLNFFLWQFIISFQLLLLILSSFAIVEVWSD